MMKDVEQDQIGDTRIRESQSVSVFLLIQPRVREDIGRYTVGYKFFCSPNSRAELHYWPGNRGERSTNKFIEMAINLAEEGTLPPCGLVRPHLVQVLFNGDGFWYRHRREIQWVLQPISRMACQHETRPTFSERLRLRRNQAYCNWLSQAYAAQDSETPLPAFSVPNKSLL